MEDVLAPPKNDDLSTQSSGPTSPAAAAGAGEEVGGEPPFLVRC
jgi:hypothetical protein